MYNFFVRIISCFIINKQKRRDFRNKRIKKLYWNEVKDNAWRMFVRGERAADIIKYCRGYDTGIAWKNINPDFWLIFVSVLWEDGKKKYAVRIIKKFFSKYKDLGVARFVQAAMAAKYAGITDENIEKSVFVYNYMQNKKDLADFFANKTVAVIGNAPNILKNDLGEQIDAHDVVIRFNNFVTAGFEKSVGSKANAWMRNSGSPNVIDRPNDFFDVSIWENDFRRYKILHNHLDILYRDIKNGKHVNFIPVSVFTDIKSILGTNPTMGVLIMHFLTKYTNVKSLDVYGFSFLDKSETLATHYYQNDKEDLKKDSVWHNIKNENEYLMNLLTKGKINDQTNNNR